MGFPTLKLPEPHDKMEARKRYELGLLDPDGFAATYFKVVEDAEAKYDMKYVSQSIVYEHDGKQVETDVIHDRKSVSDVINRNFEKVRKAIDMKMTEYLRTHDGRIDFWPDCSGTRVLVYEEEDSLSRALIPREFRFHYFGGNYGDLSRQTYRLSYCNGYRVDDDPNYNKAEERRRQLKKDIKKAEDDASPVFGVLTCIAAVYLIYMAVTMLLSLFLPIDQALIGLADTAKAMPESWWSTLLELLSTAIAIPGYARQVSFIESGTFIFLIIVCFAVSLFLFLLSGSLRGNIKKCKADKLAYDAFIESEEYKEGARYAKEAAAFAEEWHRAWFEWAKRVGDLPS